VAIHPRKGAKFKQSLKDRKYSESTITWYLKMLLPKYVWLFEFTDLIDDDSWDNQFAVDGRCRRRITGEFLYDATASPHDVRCLAFRYLNAGYVHWQDPSDDHPAVQLDPGSIEDHWYDCYTDPDLKKKRSVT
jgi:hypothetical protein